jgi:hypothetical protein
MGHCFLAEAEGELGVWKRALVALLLSGHAWSHAGPTETSRAKHGLSILG